MGWKREGTVAVWCLQALAVVLAIASAGCGDSSSSGSAPRSLQAAAVGQVDVAWTKLLDDTRVQPVSSATAADPSAFDFLIVDGREVTAADTADGAPIHDAVRRFLEARKGVLVTRVQPEDTALLSSLIPVLESSIAPHVFVSGEWVDGQLANRVIAYPETALLEHRDDASATGDGPAADGGLPDDDGLVPVIAEQIESEAADQRFAARIQDYVRRGKGADGGNGAGEVASADGVEPQIPPANPDGSDAVIYTFDTIEQEVIGGWWMELLIKPERAGGGFSGANFVPRFSRESSFSLTVLHKVWVFLDSTRRSNLLTNSVVVSSEWRANPNEGAQSFGVSSWRTSERDRSRQSRGPLPIWWAGREQVLTNWDTDVRVTDPVQLRLVGGVQPVAPRGWTLESFSPTTQNNVTTVDTTERHTRVRSRGWSVSGSSSGPGLSYRDGTRDEYEFTSSRSTTLLGWGVRENGRTAERATRWTFFSQAPLSADAPVLPTDDPAQGLNDLNRFRSNFVSVARWTYQNPDGLPSYARGTQKFLSTLRGTLYAQYIGNQYLYATVPPPRVQVGLQMEVGSDLTIAIDFDKLVDRMIANARARGAYTE